MAMTRAPSSYYCNCPQQQPGFLRRDTFVPLPFAMGLLKQWIPRNWESLGILCWCGVGGGGWVGLKPSASPRGACLPGRNFKQFLWARVELRQAWVSDGQDRTLDRTAQENVHLVLYINPNLSARKTDLGGSLNLFICSSQCGYAE